MNNERSGLLMIASSLFVILVITGLLLHLQRESRREQARVQGVSLVRLLSSVPFEQLVAATGSSSPFEVMKRSQSHPDFAYAALVDPGGAPLVQVTAPGVIVPGQAAPPDPSAWLGERFSERAEGGGARIREFFAPVLSDGELVAHVRVGFFEPGLGLAFAQVPLVALMALAIFLLTPVSYFLLRRELQPFSAANAQIQRLLEGQQLGQVQIEATGELGEFTRRFNSLLRIAEERIRALEGQRVDLIASSKVLSYKKTRMETVLETLPDAAVVMDESGMATFANAKLEAVLGIAPGEAVGKPLDVWCRDPRAQGFLAAYAGGRSRITRAGTLPLPPETSGGQVVEVGAHPLVAGPGAAEGAGTLVLFRDVTAQALAGQSQAEFVTHVAHELKAPLNVLAMYTEMLLGKDGESEEFRIEAGNVLQDEVERLSLLINTLLSIARLETGAAALEKQRVRLPDFLRDVLDTVSRGGQRAGLRFDLRLAGELHPIHVDKELLRVALNNLLTNAIKYNRDGGEVVLSAEETPEEVVIRVRDTGIGIAPGERARIFEKFYRSEREEARTRGGHGLGLTLARQIAERHGGQIRVESAIDAGSEFSIVLSKVAVMGKEPA